jgi:HSP20 family protein
VEQRSEVAPLMRMHQELDRWMDNMFNQFGMPALDERIAGAPGLLRPQLDIAERDDHYEISVEVPGVEEKDIQVTQDDQRLVIEGEKQQEQASGEKDRYQQVERAYGRFRRVLDLPADADAEGIKASFDKGVLKITVPRSAEAKSRRREIPIQS